MEFMNRHCRCALIVGPVVDNMGSCGRGECGRDPEFRVEVAGEEWRSERDGRTDEDGLEVDVDEENKAGA